MKRIILVSFVLALLSAAGLHAQSTIYLNEESGGKYTVDATVNGVGVRTYYAQENWFASMSRTTYLFLYENGYIADADVKGMTVLKMPDGSTTKAGSFVIRSLRMGNVIVKDLPAFVINKQSVPLLIGNSTFDCFGEVTVEGNKLTINDVDEAQLADAEVVNPLDSLKAAAQAHLDAKEYADAAACFETLGKQGEMNMFNEYQYIVVLNILGRSNETIEMSRMWLSENEGKSLTMDYWIYDGLGDSYARLKETNSAIESYEKAVSVYCKMFNTTEKAIKKSAFKDETLGETFYCLGRQYASANNLRKTEYNFSMAAKCGNTPAKEFCDKFKIKY